MENFPARNKERSLLCQKADTETVTGRSAPFSAQHFTLSTILTDSFMEVCLSPLTFTPHNLKHNKSPSSARKICAGNLNIQPRAQVSEHRGSDVTRSPCTQPDSTALSHLLLLTNLLICYLLSHPFNLLSR